MVEWHHRLNGHGFEQTLGGSEGQGSLVGSEVPACLAGNSVLLVPKPLILTGTLSCTQTHLPSLSQFSSSLFSGAANGSLYSSCTSLHQGSIVLYSLLCESWSLSYFRLFVTPWTVAHQPLLSLRFSKQEYWSGLSFPSPWTVALPGSCVHGILQLRILEWVAIPFSRESS